MQKILQQGVSCISGLWLYHLECPYFPLSGGFSALLIIRLSVRCLLGLLLQVLVGGLWFIQVV